MLAPPDDLDAEMLPTLLARAWQVAAVTIDYRAVGFGSHHWAVVDNAGTRWFLNVDDLAEKRVRDDEPPAAALKRLSASLAAAQELRRCGRTFVVAPLPTVHGLPVVQVTDQFAAALYPYVHGQSFAWGEFSMPAHRDAVLEMLVEVHTAPAEVASRAPADDFEIARRDALEIVLDPTVEIRDAGPYTRPTVQLLRDRSAAVGRLLAGYDELAAAQRARPEAGVLTHGEPHPGNTMCTRDSWLLIDWDTARVAPPERDLWDLDPGDGSILMSYTDATGRALRPSLLELYRIRWDLTDIAFDTSRFLCSHSGDPNDDATWGDLRRLVEALEG